MYLETLSFVWEKPPVAIFCTKIIKTKDDLSNFIRDMRIKLLTSVSIDEPDSNLCWNFVFVYVTSKNWLLFNDTWSLYIGTCMYPQKYNF